VLGKPATALLTLFFLYSLNSSALELRNSTENVIFSSEILYHPAGPAIRNEWRSSGDGRVIQLEIKNAKSSQMLVENLKLVYQNKVGWRIEDINGNVKLKINPTLVNSEKPLDIKIKNNIWVITLKNEAMHIIQHGIATETEPRIDIFMKLIN
jgi:hypothetical protein